MVWANTAARREEQHLTLKRLAHFFQNVTYFLMLYTISELFLYETGPIQ